MAELFEGRDLHPFTKVVFTASQWACQAKPFLLGLVLLLIGSICVAIFYKPWKVWVSSVILHVPYLKKLLAKVSFVRFCRSCATLLEGGLPIVTALSQSRMVMNHPVLEKVVQQAEEKVQQGEKLYTPFLNHPFIPPLVPRMLGIAEEGGKISFMMRQIAEIYEEELEKNLSYISAVAQPVLLLFLGVIVGFVLLSVLLPLTDVSSFAN
jgi:general secretion pathway protein F/type IV pilus assembly protein PilC